MGASLFRKLDDDEERAKPLFLTVDGRTVTAQTGDSIAAVLLRLEPAHVRTSAISGAARAPYCMMGVCFDCVAIVDGVASTQTCLVPARDGVRVERQAGARSVCLHDARLSHEPVKDGSLAAPGVVG